MTPQKGTGAWGSWAKLVMEGASLLGKQSTIKVLLEGEKSGEGDYKEALKDTSLSPEARTLIEKNAAACPTSPHKFFG